MHTQAFGADFVHIQCGGSFDVSSKGYDGGKGDVIDYGGDGGDARSKNQWSFEYGKGNPLNVIADSAVPARWKA